MKVCFATHNKNKIYEIQHLINSKIKIITLDELEFKEDIKETEDTYIGNAKLKAETIFNKFKIPCFADDSGLEVKILNNEPGVFSARYSGEKIDTDKKNNQLLIKNLRGEKTRNAQFVTVIVFVYSEKSAPYKTHMKAFKGILRGSIGLIEKGKNGFGYDTLFIPDQIYENNALVDNKKKYTLAELDIKNKNKISSRYKAIKKLIEFIKENEQEFI